MVWRNLITLVALLGLCSSLAHAEKASRVPKRQIPPEVLLELQQLEHEFRRAVAQDCAPERCFPRGGVYLGHTVVDQPPPSSLPGLGLDPGPGSVPSQVYLTAAECTFVHEKSVPSKSVRALSERLETKLSVGWTKVDVAFEALRPIPDSLRESPEPEPEPASEPEEDAEEVVPEAEPERLDGPRAILELWENLLPHFSWMLGLLLFTLAALILIWAQRRLGRQSPEEQALLAQMLANNGGSDTGPPSRLADDAVEPTLDAQPSLQRIPFSAQYGVWQDRIQGAAEGEVDPALKSLVADLLRDREYPLLAKAVMLFPDALPKAFPMGGALTPAKFELAEYLKTARESELPDDGVFFAKLERYALSSSLTAHTDTDLIRGLHADFGPRALVALIGTLPARYGALLFVMSPEVSQRETVRFLTAQQLFETADQGLRSNRMDPAENDYLLAVLGALRAHQPLPEPPKNLTVSDHGTELSATTALSILLPWMTPEARADLINAAVQRLNGALPDWVKGTFFGEMLLKLDVETRTDLLLEPDSTQLAAWLDGETPLAKAQLLENAPSALRAALSGAPKTLSKAQQYALAGAARATLSTGLQRRILQRDVTFESLLV